MLNEPLSYLSVVGPPSSGLERVLVPGHLAEHLVGADRQRICRSVLQRCGVTEQQAFAHGRRRRQRMRRQVTKTTHEIVPAIRMIATRDGDAASWVLHLRDLVRPFPVGGCLAVAPSHDMLMVLPLTDVASVGWLDVLLRAGRDAHAAAEHPLCRELLWVHSAGISAFHTQSQRGNLTLTPPDGFPQLVQHLAARALRTVDAVA